LGEPDLCVERRRKGELELSWGEPDPCVEKKPKQTKGFRARRYVKKERKGNEKKREKITFSTLTGVFIFVKNLPIFDLKNTISTCTKNFP
jgi:hypothetical protein